MTEPAARPPRRGVQALARLVLPAIFALGGCAHTIQGSDLSRFAEATGKVHAQADTAFIRANGVSRQAAIDLFVSARKPSISERSFPPALSPEDVAGWDQVFFDLERYGALLANLTKGGRGASTGRAVAQLGAELQGGVAKAPITPGVGAGLAALASTLVDARAQAWARSIMLATDPHIRLVLSQMAEAVGGDRQTGLQATVWSNWTTNLTGVQIAYATATEKGDEGRQRALIGDYVAGIDRRDADLRSLSALHASLLALADAHTAAADGTPQSQAAIIEGIDRRLDDLRRDITLLGGEVR